MSKRETKADLDKREASAFFERIGLKPGDTVFTILDSVSRSGMPRQVRPVIIRDGADFHPTWATGVLTARTFKRGGMHDTLVIGGCGFDAGHDLVYSLSHALWPDGFGCIGEGCPSNDHRNGDRDYTPHGAVVPGDGCAVDENEEPRFCWCHDNAKPERGCLHCGCRPAEHWHRDGGYALRSKWL